VNPDYDVYGSAYRRASIYRFHPDTPPTPPRKGLSMHPGIKGVIVAFFIGGLSFTAGYCGQHPSTLALVGQVFFSFMVGLIAMVPTRGER